MKQPKYLLLGLSSALLLSHFPALSQASGMSMGSGSATQNPPYPSAYQANPWGYAAPAYNSPARRNANNSPWQMMPNPGRFMPMPNPRQMMPGFNAQPQQQPQYNYPPQRPEYPHAAQPYPNRYLGYPQPEEHRGDAPTSAQDYNTTPPVRADAYPGYSQQQNQQGASQHRGGGMGMGSGQHRSMPPVRPTHAEGFYNNYPQQQQYAPPSTYQQQYAPPAYPQALSNSHAPATQHTFSNQYAPAEPLVERNEYPAPPPLPDTVRSQAGIYGAYPRDNNYAPPPPAVYNEPQQSPPPAYNESLPPQGYQMTDKGYPVTNAPSSEPYDMPPPVSPGLDLYPGQGHDAQIPPPPPPFREGN